MPEKQSRDIFLTSPLAGSLWETVRKARIVTLIGAGGKTTGLNRLSEELARLGKSVVATTTTKVYPQSFPVLWQDAGEAPSLNEPTEKKSPCFWYSEVEEESGKWLGISVHHVDQALQEDRQRFWVIEGDGARERKLKCWAPHEPQIPQSTETAVLVMDGRLWGRPLEENMIHRAELCPELVGQIWTPELAVEYILNSPVFYSEYKDISWVVLWNEWDDDPQTEFNRSEICSTEGHREENLNQVRKSAELLAKRTSQSLPKHLRLAAGDVKEGKLQWYDLW